MKIWVVTVYIINRHITMGYAYTPTFILYWNPYQHFYMTFQEIDDGRWQVVEVHARLTVKATLFYADDRMVASKYPVWLQSECDTLTGLFYQVGLQTNIRKVVGMVCRPCRAAAVRADEAYTRQMIGKWLSFKERHREQVLCPESDKEMSKGSMVVHHQNKNGATKGRLGQEGDELA